MVRSLRTFFFVLAAFFVLLGTTSDASTLGLAGYPGRYGPTGATGASYSVELFNSLPSNITFTRASDGGHFNPSCLWIIAGTDQPRFDHQWNTTTSLCEPRGLLIEAQRTNLLLWNRDLTNAAWTKTNMTVAKTATGLDGVANSASRLTATSNNGTVLQAITSGSAARATTAYVRRVSGTGTVEMTQNGGTNWTAVTVTSQWTRVGPASATITNPSVGFRLATSGDVIEVDYVQLESASFASSAILTTTAAATRAADYATVPDISILGWNPSAYTIVTGFEFMDEAPTQYVWSIQQNASNRLALRRGTGTASTLVNEIVVGGVGQFNINITGITPLTVYKEVQSATNNDAAAAASNGQFISATAGSIPTGLTSLYLGRDTGSVNHMYGWIRSLEIYPVRLPNSQLQDLTQ